MICPFCNPAENKPQLPHCNDHPKHLLMVVEPNDNTHVHGPWHDPVAIRKMVKALHAQMEKRGIYLNQETPPGALPHDNQN